MLTIHKSLVIIGILATSLTLAGCAPAASTNGTGSSSAVREDFNDQDVLFVQGMLPHHEQAVEMSDMILSKEGIDPRVRDLAQRFTDAQELEISVMTGWLEDWDISPAMEGMEGMDHGDGGMSGTMSDEAMASAAAATGLDASRLFLEQMTEHHSGAIEMAEIQLADGQNPAAIELAQAIADSQQAEIDEMTQILATL